LELTVHKLSLKCLLTLGLTFVYSIWLKTI